MLYHLYLSADGNTETIILRTIFENIYEPVNSGLYQGDMKGV